MTPTGASASRANRGVIAFTRWFSVVMFAGFAVAGGFAFWGGWQERSSNKESVEWPEASGRVSRAWVKTSDVKTSRNPGAQHQNERYEVMVDFSFTAEGQAVTNTALAPRQVAEDEGQAAAQTIADSLAPGTPITIYYKPGNPRQNRLRRVEVSPNTWMWVGLIGGSLVALVSLFGIWWMLSRFERPKECAPRRPAGDAAT
jgi:hypothetical protein